MSPKLPVLTPKQLVRALQNAGFIIDRQRGSHISLVHPVKNISVTVSYHNRDIKKGTLKGILNDVGLSVDQLIELL